MRSRVLLSACVSFALACSSSGDATSTSSADGDTDATDAADSGSDTADGAEASDGADGADSADGVDGAELPPVSGELPSCGDALFVDAIAEDAWHTIDVGPAGGTEAIRNAFDEAAGMPDMPVRIRLAEGVYEDTLGGEVYVQRLMRTETTPVLLTAANPTPGATQLHQGLNFVGVAYLAIEGLTIGPATVGDWDGAAHADPQPLQAAAGVHVSGAAKAGGDSALADGALNPAVYGQYEPSHHIVVRNLTIRNLFGKDDPSGEAPVGQDNDGMKFNQAQHVWVIGNHITQTSRHGIDNVGVRDAVFCKNVISRNGQGMGIEAKAGSIRVVFENNVFYRVRRVALGGENSDATYYWSEDGSYAYEGRQIVARNNLIVDPRESAFDFAACHDCAAIGNTVWFTSGYTPPLTEDGQANGGDAIRVHDSLVLSADEGAGSGCSTWSDAESDYVYVDPCWGVGSAPPSPAGKALTNAKLVVRNNVFGSAAGIFSTSFGSSEPNPSTIPCPLNLLGVDASLLTMDHNAWWNGGKGYPTEYCPALPEGDGSLVMGPDALGFSDGVIDDSTLGSLTTAQEVLRPSSDSPLKGAGAGDVTYAAPYDLAGAPRANPPTIGALEAP